MGEIICFIEFKEAAIRDGSLIERLKRGRVWERKVKDWKYDVHDSKKYQKKHWAEETKVAKYDMSERDNPNNRRH